MTRTRPAHIGLFDSGIGGLSVLRALRQQLPELPCTCVADTRYTPWGERPADWVQARCLQLAGWLIEQAGAELVLVACNTATTQAIAALRARWPHVPFVGVEPGVRPAVAASRNGRVAVLATPGALASGRTRSLLDELSPQADTLLALPCPGLAEAIEAEAVHPDALARQLDAIAECLRAARVDSVALGCTHYPLVADALAQRLPAGTTLVDTAPAVVRRVAQLLGLALPATPEGQDSLPRQRTAPGALRLHATARPSQLQQAARRWLHTDTPAQLLDLPAPAQP